ncbi:hypothetical protein NUM3379_26530 [Kineococcus sp. NUM-3379]
MSAPARAGAATGVLALVVAFQLVAETALTPYFPALFRELFGTADLGGTGAYLTACRVAGLLALPLWGLAARRWPLPRLLVAGLLGSAVFDAGLAVAPDLAVFTALSAGVVATGSSLVLAYPALVAVADRRLDRRAGAGRAGTGGGSRPGSRTGALVTYAVVFHVASVVATAVGAGILALPQPRLGLAAFAVADLLLALAVWRVVPASACAPGPAGAVPAARRVPLRPLLLVAALAVLVDTGTSVGRPFFAELVLAGGGSLGTAAALFLLPSAAALAVLPAAARLAGTLPRGLLPVAAGAAAAGCLVQAVGAGSLPALAAGRVVLGAGLGLLAVALDGRVFAVAGTSGPGFTAVETARSAALLAAPVLASATAAAALPLPLAAGAALLGAAALLALVPAAPAAVAGRRAPGPPSESDQPDPTPETSRALDPVR